MDKSRSDGVVGMMTEPFRAVCKSLISRIFAILWDKAIV
jgi:hypothetical protein